MVIVISLCSCATSTKPVAKKYKRRTIKQTTYSQDDKRAKRISKTVGALWLVTVSYFIIQNSEKD